MVQGDGLQNHYSRVRIPLAPPLFLAALVLTSACRARPKAYAPDAGPLTLLQAPQGSLASLKDLRGEVLVLEFWATWCGPCREMIPHMNKMADSFSGRPVRFLSVTDESQDKVAAFLKDHPMRAWIGLDPGRSAFRAFKVTSVPQVYVIDPYGRIWHHLEPMFFYNSDIEDALKAPAPVKAEGKI